MLVRALAVVRSLAPVTVILFIGASVTVGVAWHCAVTVDVTAHPVGAVVYEPEDWGIPSMTLWSHKGAERVLSNETFGGINVQGGRFERIQSNLPRGAPPVQYPSWSLEGHGGIGFPRDAAAYDGVVEDARGWPFLSMRCTFYLRGGDCTGAGTYRDPNRPKPAPPEMLMEYQGDASFGASLASGGIALPTRDGIPDRMGKTASALPLFPIWPGFLVDTLIFGSPMLVPYLIWSCFRVTRRWVWRRGGRCIECGYQLAAAQSICSECGVTSRTFTESPPDTPG